MTELPRLKGWRKAWAYLQGPHSHNGILIRYWKLRDEGVPEENPMVQVLRKRWISKDKPE